MKKLIAVFTLFTQFAFLSAPAFATPGRILSADVINGLGNSLKNASFERTTYDVEWTYTTITRNSVAETSTIAPGSGKQAAKLSFTAQTGAISQSQIPAWNTNSTNFEAACKVNTSLPTIQLCSLSGGTEIQCQNVPATSTWQPISVNFIGPTNGTSIGVKVKTTASTTGTVYVDDCYVGPARNLSQVSQAQYLGDVKVTGCSASWSVANPGTSYVDFPTTLTGCTYTISSGAVGLSAASNNLPGFNYTGGPGRIEIVATGYVQFVPSSTSSGFFRFYDGSTYSDEENTLYSLGGTLDVPSITGSFTYTAPQTNTPIRVRTKTDTGNGTSYLFGQTAYPMTFKVYYFPSQSQLALRPDATPASWSGYISGCSTKWSMTGQTTSTDFTAGSTTSCTLTQTANRNFGTVTMGTNVPQITFTPPRLGNYAVCAYVQADTSTSTNANIVLTDSANNYIANGNITQTAQQTYPICGEYNVASPGAVTLKLRGNVPAAQTLYAGDGWNEMVKWTIVELDAPMPAPYLTGSVTSNTSGSERVERVAFGGSTYCASSPCSINSQTGAWVSSITRNGAGDYSVVVPSGMFSAVPTCSVTPINWNGTPVVCIERNTSTSTAVNVGCYNTSNTAEDASMNVICQGPR